MTGSNRRQQGGKGALRPSAIRAAAERLVLRELPVPLPVQPWERKEWAACGLTVAQVLAAIDGLARAGLVKVKPDGGGWLAAMRATTTASTIAATPATNGEDNQWT